MKRRPKGLKEKKKVPKVRNQKEKMGLPNGMIIQSPPGTSKGNQIRADFLANMLMFLLQ